MGDLSARGAANPQTIREHITKAIAQVELGMSGPALMHLDTALELLDSYDRVGHGIAATHTDRLVPDPAPRGDAEPGASYECP